ncbi:MAG: alpha/beta hydrolase, partial [Alphaproteobacteria bacterium]|nr:alpha/beta hydrolase [Alphaproteobacteria bacterium]
DILANDGLALIAHLALSEYDLGGFSLGARTTVRMLIACARPRRVIIAGMGLQGLLHTHARTDFFKRVLDHPGSFARGTPEWSAEAFLKTSKGDANALRLLLDSFADSTREEIAGITAPCGIICGDQDNDNGSAAELAAVLPDAHFTQIPGTHMGCVVRRELGEAIRDFLLA